MKKASLLFVENNKTSNAGPKAKDDMQKILTQHGFESLTVPIEVKSFFNKIKAFIIDLPLLLRKSKQFDELVIQYPLYSKFLTQRFFKLINKKLLNTKIILLVHDVESLRLRSSESDFIKREISYFNQVDGLIVHTDSMKKWLLDKGVTTPMVVLNLFDYLNPQPVIKDIDYKKSIVYAGNLKKSEFLSKLNPSGYQLDVFGPNPLPNFPVGVNYQGVRNPDELPKELQYNFGLVWDGSTTETCDGLFGEYMRFNSPHKASLYLSSGIPIIVWKDAAISQFIIENGLGIAVKSLTDLTVVLNEMNTEMYNSIKKETLIFSMKLRNGENVLNAIKSIEKELV